MAIRLLSVSVLGCVALALAGSSSGLGRVSGRGDFDGDGHVDRAFVQHRGVDGNGRPWFLVVKLATGRRLVFPLSHAAVANVDVGILPCYNWCAIHAVHDLNGDGRSEIMVRVGDGASYEIFVVFQVAHGHLRQLHMTVRGKAQAAQFASGGGTTHGSVLLCRGKDVVYQNWYAAEKPRLHWNVLEKVYRLRGDLFVWRYDKHFTRPDTWTGKIGGWGGGHLCG